MNKQVEVALYFHIPFCVKKCPYCSFHSVESGSLPMDAYVDSLLREMRLCRDNSELDHSAGTLFFGGGTPSLMEPAHLEKILDGAAELFGLRGDAEISIEANPGTLSREKLDGFRRCGINRLSLGVQSFSDPMLRRLGRIHAGADAVEAFRSARNSGFANVGVDLICSLPGQTVGMWEEDLLAAIELEPEHISAYGLTIEEGTPFAALEEAGSLELPEEEEAALMYERTGEILNLSGYEHYEISNYARPGFRSLHNQVYWRRGDYLGFGSGAHTFTGGTGFGVRRHNVDDIGAYMRAVNGGCLPWRERHELGLREAMAERLFLGLRMLEGIDLDMFRDEFGIAFEEAYPEQSSMLLGEGFLEIVRGRLRLTGKSLLVSNRIFVMFL